MYSFLLVIIYMAFISLGLPDSLVGSAWPVMHTELNVPVSYAGMITMVIAAGTVVSSLLSDRLTKRFGAGLVTAVSVFMTAVALFGFSVSGSFVLLCLWAIPYGLGAGAVDAALNNYVALHYASRHMSWLHCFWGLGAAASPYIMRYCLTGGYGWHSGYRTVSIIQFVLTAGLFISLPLWKQVNGGKRSRTQEEGTENGPVKALGLLQTMKIKGVPLVMAAFFSYCALEQTTMLWASSYMVHAGHMSIHYAGIYANLFFIGLTLGSVIAGCLALRLSDGALLGGGLGVLVAALVVMIVPMGSWRALVAPVMLGFGCAPINPAVVHMTPRLFGAVHTMTMIGWETAVIAVATLVSPVLFAVFSATVGMAALPWYLACFTSLGILAAVILMSVSHLQSRAR